MTSKIFITGTDTGVGKTYIAVGLLKTLKQKGLTTFAIKPIASGCNINEDGMLHNEDALLLRNSATIKKEYQFINPFPLYDPIAPSIAAEKQKIVLNADFIVKKINSLIDYTVDMNVIEGVGGWCVPLNDAELMSDVIKTLNIPVLLVVGIRLGCLNHAILSMKAMQQDGVTVLGWIANCIDPNMLEIDENICTLQNYLNIPCLGKIPYREDPGKYINLEALMQRNIL